MIKKIGQIDQNELKLTEHTKLDKYGPNRLNWIGLDKKITEVNNVY